MKPPLASNLKHTGEAMLQVFGFPNDKSIYQVNGTFVFRQHYEKQR